MLKILGLGLRIYGKLVSINWGPNMDEMERRTLNPNQVGLQGSGSNENPWTPAYRESGTCSKYSQTSVSTCLRSFRV